MQPVGSKEKLDLQLVSCAELLRAAGHYIPVDDNATAREVELALESIFLDFELCQYVSMREPCSATAWQFVLAEGINVEEAV